jgi:hypothetical protein
LGQKDERNGKREICIMRSFITCHIAIAKCNEHDLVKEDEIGRECSMHWGRRIYVGFW